MSACSWRTRRSTRSAEECQPAAIYRPKYCSPPTRSSVRPSRARAQIHGAALQLTTRDRIAVSYQVFTPEGRVATGKYKVFKLDLKPETRDSVARHGFRFVDRLRLRPGRYELRLVADQPEGALGAIVAQIDVPAFDEPLALSGLALSATSTAGHRRLLDDEAVRRGLGADPTSVRRFRPGDTLSVFAEVYSTDARVQDDDLSVTGTITTADAAPVATATGVPARVTSGGAGRWAFRTDFSLADAAPGEYVLTIDARSARHPDRSARRQLPFRVALD